MIAASGRPMVAPTIPLLCWVTRNTRAGSIPSLQRTCKFHRRRHSQASRGTLRATAVLAAAPNKPACAGGTSTKRWKGPACATIQTGLFRNKPACAGGTSTKVRKIQLVSRTKRIFSATNEPKSERHPKGCARFSYQSKNILFFRAKAHKTIVIMQNAARTAQISIFGFQ